MSPLSVTDDLKVEGVEKVSEATACTLGEDVLSQVLHRLGHSANPLSEQDVASPCRHEGMMS